MKTYKTNKDVEITKEEAEKALEFYKTPVKNWRAEKGEEYFTAYGNGEVLETSDYRVLGNDIAYITGNYFQTAEEAEAYREYLLAKGTVTRAINEANGDWVADWSDSRQRKYLIDLLGVNIGFDYNYDLKYPLSIPWIKDGDTAEQIIADHKEDLLTVHNYEV